MGLSPLWGHHDHTCISLWVDAFFCVLDTHLGVVLLRWRREHGDPASRFPVFLLASLEMCCGSCPGYGHALSLCRGLGGPTISSSSRVLLQPCLGTGTAAGRSAVRAAGAESCLHGRLSLPCLSLFLSLYLPLSREPAAPICSLAITHSWPGRHQEVVQEGSRAEAWRMKKPRGSLSKDDIKCKCPGVTTCRVGLRSSQESLQAGCKQANK